MVRESAVSVIRVAGVLVAALAVACGGKSSTEHERERGGTGGAAGSASGGSGGVAANRGSCEPYCASTADCCTDCTYPNNLVCVDRHCESLGCTGDLDCVRVEGPTSVCRASGGPPQCVVPCQSNDDCNASAPACVNAGTAESYCGKLPGLILPCNDDTDCILGICNPTTHGCGCSQDDQCPGGYVCVAWD